MHTGAIPSLGSLNCATSPSFPAAVVLHGVAVLTSDPIKCQTGAGKVGGLDCREVTLQLERYLRAGVCFCYVFSYQNLLASGPYKFRRFVANDYFKLDKTNNRIATGDVSTLDKWIAKTANLCDRLWRNKQANGMCRSKDG